MIGLVVLVKVDLEARVNNMIYRDYGELLEDQIADMKMRLQAYREGQRDNRARLAKQHGVKFVNPNEEIQSLKDQVEKLTSYNGELVELIERTNSQMNMNTVKNIVEMHKLRRKLL